MQIMAKEPVISCPAQPAQPTEVQHKQSSVEKDNVKIPRSCILGFPKLGSPYSPTRASSKENVIVSTSSICSKSSTSSINIKTRESTEHSSIGLPCRLEISTSDSGDPCSIDPIVTTKLDEEEDVDEEELTDYNMKWLEIFNAKLKQRNTNMFVIETCDQLEELLYYYYRLQNRFSFEYSEQLFPYLFGLNNLQQCSYYCDDIDVESYKQQLKKVITNNIMFLKNDDTTSIPELLNTVDVNSILNFRDGKYKPLDLEITPQIDGTLNCRNFEQQTRIMAPLSHFVVYNYSSKSNDDLTTILGRIVPTHNYIYSVEINEKWWDTLDEYYFNNDNDETKIYNNNVLDEILPQSEEYLPNDDSFSCKFLKYEQNLAWRLNSRKWILNDRVCLGNIRDFKALRQDSREFKLIINCLVEADLPSIENLEIIWQDYSQNNDSTYYLEFPSSGRLNPLYLIDSNLIVILNVLNLVEKISRLGKVFIFSYDGFTGASMLAIAVVQTLLKTSMEEAIVYLSQSPAKIYFFKSDVSFLQYFEFLIDYLVDPSTPEHFNLIPPNIVNDASNGNHNLHSSVYDWFSSYEDNNFPSRIFNNVYLGSLNHANSETILNTLGITHLISIGAIPEWWHILAKQISFDFEGPRSKTKIKPIYSFNDNKSQIYQVDLTGIKLPRHIQSLKSLIYIHNFNDDGKDSILPLLIDSPVFIQEKILLGPNKNKYQSQATTLIHCKIGVSRSASIVIASLMKQFRLSLVQAYMILRVLRFNIIIQPNLKLFHDLYLYESYLGVLEQNTTLKKWNWECLCRELYKLNDHYL